MPAGATRGYDVQMTGTTSRAKADAWRMGMIGASVLLVAGCSPTGQGTVAERPPAPPASLTFSVRDAKKPVNPDERLGVTVQGGEFVSVRLTGPKGETVPGRVENGVWQLPEETRLRPDTTYTWVAVAKNADGKEARANTKVRTIEPDVAATYRVTPDKETVGVGMPVMVTFDSEVKTPEMRRDIEKRMKITVSPAQKGSWGWVDSRQLMWRPEVYWKKGTKINVKAPLTGVQTGEDKWITQDKGASFTIADRARVSVVDIDDHVMTVKEDGKEVATYPVSSGKPIGTWETRTGTKVITEKHESYVMDAGTLGLDENNPNYYKTEVRYAMRVTNTGEFLHSAPWTTWAQGRRNVSHGCVNLGPRAARQMFQQSIVGDVVEFIDSDRKMKPGDGLSVWLYSPQEWKKLSAL